MHRLLNILLAMLIAVLLSTSHLLDGPNDIAAAQASADSLQDAKKAATQVAQVQP